jgi:polyhydroxyalkanoate synthesis regulator phasin
MNAETKRMIETTDWDALAERAENTTYDISEMRPETPEERIRRITAADNTLRRIALEELRAEIDGLRVEIQSEVDGLQSKANSLRARINDLVLVK